RNAISSLARTGTGQSNRKGALLQRGLIATQLALSMVLLTDAFLLSRSFRQLASVDPGFVSQHLSAVRIAMPYRVFQEAGKNRFAAQAIQRRFASLPGVSRAVLASGSPFAGGFGSSPVLVEGADKDNPNARGIHTQQRYVSPGYFETMGFRLIRGRLFTAGDVAGGLNVAVLSAAQVKRDFPGRNPIGLRIKHQGQWREIVGVVSDVKHRALKVEPDPTLYVPFDQYPSTTFFVIVRESAGTSNTLDAYRRALREVEANAVVSSVRAMPSLIAASYSGERYRLVLIVAFACIAALLAAVGMYGVGARAAARRTREVGIRLALGSTKGAIARLMLGDAVRGVFIGLAIGVPATIALGRFVQPFLFGVSSTDAVSYMATAVLLAAVTLLASYVPSRRASRADPAVVLRND
ncbi:MAG: ABC transporter permease, partial [Phycisphaerae bacterium]|nr:ABC transporter permease [Gemmatimonadaceae bacterium]